jgi:hypothetical protein
MNGPTSLITLNTPKQQSVSRRCWHPPLITNEKGLLCMKSVLFSVETVGKPIQQPMDKPNISFIAIDDMKE